MVALKLKIDGMHCGSCSKVISMNLGELDGIGKIDINDQSKIAQIEFDENKTSQDMIIETIKNSGYKPTVL